MSPERETFLRKLKARNYARSSIINYERALVKAACYLKKSPLYWEDSDIENFVLYELKEQKLDPSTVNLHINSFKTFYKLVAPDKRSIMNKVQHAKGIHKLPVVLSESEVAEMLHVTSNLKHLAVIETLYSTGVRLQECMDLKPEDIDSRQMLVNIRSGKGRKQRFTIISHTSLKTLRDYYTYYKPKRYMFEGMVPGKQLSTRMAGKIVRDAAKRACIGKKVTAHTMRHTFATHLLEHHTDLRTIQKLLGHNCIKTTTIYLHLSNAKISTITNPLDIIAENRKGGNRW